MESSQMPTEKTTESDQLDSSQSKYPGHQQQRGADEEVRSLEEEKEAVLYPDGGYGWAVTFGIFLALLLMGGLQFCWGESFLYYLPQISAKNGIMQDYYEREVFGRSSNTTVQLSFAGTLVTVMMYLFSYPAEILYNKLGAKVMIFIATILVSAGLGAAGSATEIWHLYLSMSICGGIGISIYFNTCVRVLLFWFDKKRNIAYGITGSAQPFAGLVMPFIITPINNYLGAPWTFRILGLSFLVINLIACILIRETADGKKARKSAKRQEFDCKVFAEPNVILWIIQGPIQIGCMLLPYTFLPSYATYIGLSDTQGSAVISVICGMGFLGRISIGLLADRIGRLNTLILSSIVSGFSCLVIWMLAYSFESLLAYGVIYGLFCGGYATMCPTVTAFLVGMDRYPTVVSVVITMCALGCIGSTAASAIESISSATPFLTYKVITGGGYILGAALAFILKLRLNRNVLAKL